MNLTKIFLTPQRWIKGTSAINKDGSPVSFTQKWGENPKEPYAFSLQGAVAWHSEPDQTRIQIMDRLSSAISAYTGRTHYVAQWNDLPETTFEDLMNVLKIYNKKSQQN